MKKIVLAVLNAKYIHLSPAPWCLAAGIKKYAPELYPNVTIFDATINQKTEDVLLKISDLKPSIIGFCCYIWNIEKTLELSKLLKEKMPDLKIILGGPEVTFRATEIIQNYDFIDYVAKGEGEECIPEFLRASINFNDEKIQNISGITGRKSDGTIFDNKAVLLKNPPPSPITAGYSDALKGRISYIETSRGCPYTCAFCLSGIDDKPRFYSLDEKLNDLIEIANSGTKTIKFVDRTFNANPMHCNEILQFILDNYNKTIPNDVCFHFEIAGDILREETFNLLEKMPLGAVQLEIGMQSFCEKTLKSVHRKTNTDILKKNITRLVNMKNMHIHIDLIAGLPFEDYDTFKNSFNVGYSLNAQALQLGFLKLLRGSAMREKPNEFPCSYSNVPPYQVINTPYMDENDFEKLIFVEDALERIYNSGRFLITAKYMLSIVDITPFDFYYEIGKEFHTLNLPNNISLDDYTKFLYEYLNNKYDVNKDELRDCFVLDRLETIASVRLPSCLFVKDENMSKVKKYFSKKEFIKEYEATRCTAILYGKKKACFVCYVNSLKNRVTSRWKVTEIPMDVIINDNEE